MCFPLVCFALGHPTMYHTTGPTNLSIDWLLELHFLAYTQVYTKVYADVIGCTVLLPPVGAGNPTVGSNTGAALAGGTPAGTGTQPVRLHAKPLPH